MTIAGGDIERLSGGPPMSSFGSAVALQPCGDVRQHFVPRRSPTPSRPGAGGSMAGPFGMLEEAPIGRALGGRGRLAL